MEKQIDTFQTTDLKSACYLLTMGVSLIRLIKDDPRKIIFCFSQNQDIKRLLQEYWTNRAMANPRMLLENLDYLKDAIHRDYDV